MTKTPRVLHLGLIFHYTATLILRTVKSRVAILFITMLGLGPVLAQAQTAMDRAKANFSKKYPDYKFEDINEDSGLTISFYTVEGMQGEALYGEDGDWLLTAIVVKDIPAQVKAGILKAYPKAKFTGYRKVQRQDGQMYNVYLEMPDGGEFDIYVDANGREI